MAQSTTFYRLDLPCDLVEFSFCAFYALTCGFDRHVQMNRLSFIFAIVTFNAQAFCMSRDMRFPTMWYVRSAKPQISLRICTV